MALIREQQAGRAMRDAVVLDLGDLAAQGERIKALARAEAAATIAAAKRERDALLKGAKERGFAAGFEEGKEQGRAAGREEGRAAAAEAARVSNIALAAAWTTALDRFIEQREAMLVSARGDILVLAVRFAERIVKRIVELDGDVAARNLGAIVPLVTRGSGLVVRVAPGDLASVQAVLPPIVAKLASDGHARLVADEALAPGSCVVSTSGGGVIDASVETQLDRLVDALLPPRAAVTNTVQPQPVAAPVGGAA